MEDTLVFLVASVLDFNTLVAFNRASKDIKCAFDRKEPLNLLRANFKLPECNSFCDFVREYSCCNACMKSFSYLRPTQVLKLAAKALDLEMVKVSYKQHFLVENSEDSICTVDNHDARDAIKYAMKASIKENKEVVHEVVLYMYNHDSCSGKYDSYITNAYYYGCAEIGNSFMNNVDYDEMVGQYDLLSAACHGGLIDYVKNILDNSDYDLETLDEFLYMACRGKQREVINYLISNGALFETINTAIRSGFLDLVIQVHTLKKNITADKYNKYIALADRKGHTEISDYLKSCM